MRMQVFRSGPHGRVTLGASFKEYRESVWRAARAFPPLFPREKMRLTALAALLCAWAPIVAVLAWQELWWALALPPLWTILVCRPWYRGWGSALWAPVALYIYLLIAAPAVLGAMFGANCSWKGRQV
jgi:hypothetical protein